MASPCVVAHFHALDEHDLPRCLVPCGATMEPKNFHDIAVQTITDSPPCFTMGKGSQGC